MRIGNRESTPRRNISPSVHPADREYVVCDHQTDGRGTGDIKTMVAMSV